MISANSFLVLLFFIRTFLLHENAKIVASVKALRAPPRPRDKKRRFAPFVYNL